MYDVIIIGAGCAGLAAAMYCGRFKMNALVISKDIGGLLTTAHLVENYPGIVSITGYDIMKKFREHAEHFGAKIIEDEVKTIKKEKGGFRVYTSKKEYQAITVILAMGSVRRKLNIPGEKEFLGKGISYCASCLPPEESVILNSSIKEIKEVNPLSRVLTVDGTYQDIEGFTKQDYSGKLVSIKLRFFNEPVLLTPNHPVLTVKKDKWCYYKKDFRFTEPEWVGAGNLTTEHAVLYPIIREVKDVDKIKLSEYVDVEDSDGFVKPKRSTYTSNFIPSEIKIDSDFLRLAGYYIAEGNSSKHILLFSFNKNEIDYIDDITNILKKIFKLKVNIKIVDNVCRVLIYSKPIADLFRNFFGKYAHNKQVPHWIMILPPDKQKEIIKGMWRGDGCNREKDFCYVTSSRQLAYQLRDLLLRQGIIPSLQLRKVDSLNQYKSEIRGRRIYFRHNKYSIIVAGQFLNKMGGILGLEHSLLKTRKSINKHAWIYNNFAILPIKEIKEVSYSGNVLNLSVRSNNTYVAKNFVVHNCDAAFFKDKVVGVVGGSDAAGTSALLLTDYAKKVYILYRGDDLKVEPVTMENIKKKKNKIEIIYNVNVKEAKGDKVLNKVLLDNGEEMKLDGLFIEIGEVPSTALAKSLGVKINDKGEIITNQKTETNVEGVYAAGDVTDDYFKQAIVCAAEGSIAAFSIYKYLLDKKRDSKK